MLVSFKALWHVGLHVGLWFCYLRFKWRIKHRICELSQFMYQYNIKIDTSGTWLQPNDPTINYFRVIHRFSTKFEQFSHSSKCYRLLCDEIVKTLMPISYTCWHYLPTAGSDQTCKPVKYVLIYGLYEREGWPIFWENYFNVAIEG